MNFQQTLSQLCSLRNFGSKLGLERMRKIMQNLGDPQNDVPAIHLAGTNGKGSTAAICEAILRSRNKKVGLYTSPHLLQLGERIQVNREMLPNEKIAEYVDEIYAAAREFGVPGDPDFPTFFELMTAMAFLHFSRERCDFAVIETGLGGRLDATNILVPAVAKTAIITSIGLDHCDILGDTHAKIAAEKAGIIKSGQDVFSGWLPVPASEVIEETCRSRGANFHDVEQIFAGTPLPQTNLFGAHQRRNAALAVAATNHFGQKIPEISWAGRWQKFELSDGRELILDVAHNEECARALAEMLENFGRPLVAIVGVLGENRARPILATIAKWAKKIIFVVPANERACDFETLKNCVPANFSGTLKFSSVPALFPFPKTCVATTPNGETLLIAGSCYLAGEVLAALTGTPSFQAQLQDKIVAGKIL